MTLKEFTNYHSYFLLYKGVGKKLLCCLWAFMYNKQRLLQCSNSHAQNSSVCIVAATVKECPHQNTTHCEGRNLSLHDWWIKVLYILLKTLKHPKFIKICNCSVSFDSVGLRTTLTATLTWQRLTLLKHSKLLHELSVVTQKS